LAVLSRKAGRVIRDLLYGPPKFVELSDEERKKAREEKEAALMEELKEEVAREQSEAGPSEAQKRMEAMKTKQDVLKKRVEDVRARRLLEVNKVSSGVEVKDKTPFDEEMSSSLPSSTSSSASDEVPRERSEAGPSEAEKPMEAMKAKQELPKKVVEEVRARRLLEVNQVMSVVEVKYTTPYDEEKSSSLPSSSSSSASEEVARERSEAGPSEAEKPMEAMKAKQDLPTKLVEEVGARRLLEVNQVLSGVEVKDTTPSDEEKSSSLPSSSSSSASEEVARERSEAGPSEAEKPMEAMKAKQDLPTKLVEEFRARTLLEVNQVLSGVEEKDTTPHAEEKSSSLLSSSSSSASSSTSPSAPKSRLAPWRVVLQLVRSATEAVLRRARLL